MLGLKIVILPAFCFLLIGCCNPYIERDQRRLIHYEKIRIVEEFAKKSSVWNSKELALRLRETDPKALPVIIITNDEEWCIIAPEIELIGNATDGSHLLSSWMLEKDMTQWKIVFPNEYSDFYFMENPEP